VGENQDDGERKQKEELKWDVSRVYVGLQLMCRWEHQGAARAMAPVKASLFGGPRESK
jgi:hypothetical protein